MIGFVFTAPETRPGKRGCSFQMEIRRGDGQRGYRIAQPLQLASLGNYVLQSRGRLILDFAIAFTCGGEKEPMSGDSSLQNA